MKRYIQRYRIGFEIVEICIFFGKRFLVYSIDFEITMTMKHLTFSIKGTVMQII